MRQWKVWPEFLHYKVAKCVWDDWGGSGYLLAKYSSGMFRRFLTRKQAQRYADFLNYSETECRNGS